MRNESRDMEAETMYLSNLFCSWQLQDCVL